MTKTKTLVGTPDSNPNPFYETLAITAAHLFEARSTKNSSSETESTANTSALEVAVVAFSAAVYFAHSTGPEATRRQGFVTYYCDGLRRGLQIVKLSNPDNPQVVPTEQEVMNNPEHMKLITGLAVDSVCQARLDQEGSPFLIRYFSGSETNCQEILTKAQRHARLAEALQNQQLILGRLLSKSGVKD